MSDIYSLLGGTRNELCAGIDWDTYRSIVALNPSTIVYGLTSPRHLLHAWTTPRKDTDDLRWGRAAHCLLFEPGEFEKRYAVWTGGRRAGNDYKDFVSECWENGKEVISQADFDSLLVAANSYIDEPLIKPILDKGQAEVTLFHVEDFIQCRGRVDWISSSAHVLVDLKTSRNIASRPFGRDFYKYHYDVKLGLYQRWLNLLTGEHWPVVCICMENSAPFDITVVPIADAVLTRGCDKGLSVISEVRRCIESKSWPGIARGEEYFLDTPVWEMEDAELDGAEEVTYGE